MNEYINEIKKYKIVENKGEKIIMLANELEINNEIKSNKEQKNTKTKRQGNIEILRIVCMILIIVHHYCVHGGLQNVDTSLANEFVTYIGIIIGKFASNTFALITGFFLFKYKFKMQKVIKIYLQAVFYAILVSIMAIILLGTRYVRSIKYAIFPISLKISWFATAYIAIYMLIPFIKPILDKLTKINYLRLLIVLGIGITVIPSIANIFVGGIETFGEVISLLYLVMIGGFISKFDFYIFKKKKYDIIGILVMLIVLNKVNYLTNNQIGSVAVAILLFDLFRKIYVKNSKIITFFSSACLATLLLHDNKYFSELMWMNIFKTQDFYNAPVTNLLIHILVCIVCIFLISAIIDFIRRKVEDKFISKHLDNNEALNKINEVFDFNI